MRRGVAIVCALVIPGSGHVLLGRPMRGLVFLFWIIIFGWLTFHLTSEGVSLIGRLSGGIAVWVISVLEVSRTSARPPSR
jgi:TM2 domain-containing membrane protein YozV